MERTAVIMCHGMGQQVPFQTLNEGIELATRENSDWKLDRVDFMECEECRIPHATVRDGHGAEADLYEVYWAPLTEGRVSVRETIRFLLQGAACGLAQGGAPFRRFVFGEFQTYPMPRGSRSTILLVLLALVSFLLAFANFFISSAAFLLGGLHAPYLRVALLLGLLPAAIVAALGFAVVMRIPADRPIPEEKASGVADEGKSELYEFSIKTGIAILALADAFVLAPSLLAASAWASVWWDLLIAPMWCAAVVGFLWVHGVFIQYIGDVAAYVSSHEVNKFFALRDEIHQHSNRVFRAVYAAKEGESFRYQRILVVGHSLGSVIAYDGLNRLFFDDEHRQLRLNAAGRTKLLLTFGSPLDKTAFFFRTQTKEAKARESLAETLQPLIHNHEYRRFPWINVYATRDIISGSLEFYNDSTGDPERSETAVLNLVDPEASTPLLAHTEYYKTRLTSGILQAALSGDPDLVAHLAAVSAIQVPAENA
jgi:hypothetical protein